MSNEKVDVVIVGAGFGSRVVAPVFREIGCDVIDVVSARDPAAVRVLCAADVDLIAASDTEYPLLGPWGAARVFGPQKGADPPTVIALESRLTEWAAEIDAAAGRAVSAEPGAGAAGGIGAGLLALGGRCESGAEIIAEHALCRRVVHINGVRIGHRDTDRA